MSVFGNYARYYDLLYRDKNYLEETLFIHHLLQTYAPEAVSILELGCGTGAHAVHLAEKGYSIYGVDMSEQMLAKSRDRATTLPSDIAARLQFSQGDIRDFRISQQFDVVISLFHVMSYQATNQDLLNAFKTAKAHLKEGGLFIFDCWYGPAVLSEQPATRIKRLEDTEISVTRLAEPVLHSGRNTVDVHYQVFVRDKQTDVVEELQEVHSMRYLFHPEIELFLELAGLKLIHSGEWMTDSSAGLDTWSVHFLAKV